MKARGVFFLTVFFVFLIHHSLSAETSGDWTYTVSDNQATITGYSGDGGAVEIPAEVDGVSVVKVGDEAFKNNTSVTSVTIPDSVTSIGNYAFESCTSLISVTILDGVTTIGGSAFGYCINLTSITIPESVTNIGAYAFESCTSLNNVTIGNSVETIGQWAFHSCTSLTSITIPDGVTNIGVGAFVLCDSLSIINVGANNSNYSSVDGVLFNEFQTALIQYPIGKSGSSYNIPDGVTSIGDYTFYGSSLTSVTIGNSVTSIGEAAFGTCTSLLSITIPDSVTSIGNGAFNYCTSLNNVTIPDSVTSIGAATFWGCTSLNNVTIPDSVTSIGDYAFHSCTSLISITIPDSVTSIGNSAFSNCDSLTSVNVDTDNLNYSSVDGVLFNKLQTSLITYPAGKLDDFCTIPDSVTIIGISAFDSCSSLLSITIPDSVTSIGDYAFTDCTSLISVTLPVTLFMEGNYTNYSLSADQVRAEKTSIDTFVANAETVARILGQTDVTGDPATYSLYTAEDVTSAEAIARTAGQNDVTGDPATYSLYTATDVTGARTLGQQDVVNDPSSFDLYTASDLVVPKFLNLSNRAYVGTGDEILIGSMIIVEKPMRIFVRVSGPSLANAAVPVPNPLLDPTLQLVRVSDGATIGTNDNWEDDLEQKTLIASTGIPPSDSREPAMVATVDPGDYSFVIRGVGDTTGFAALEIYEFAE